MTESKLFTNRESLELPTHKPKISLFSSVPLLAVLLSKTTFASDEASKPFTMPSKLLP
jgi:hypothetical protein